MDALAEILRIIRIDSAIYFNAEFCEPWCLTSPEAGALAPLLTSRGAHVIIYHLLCDGQAYVQLGDGEARVPLGPGDLVTFPHGHGHTLGSGRAGRTIDAFSALPAVLERGLAPLQFGGTGSRSRFICGFLACDPLLSQAFLSGLPSLVKVNIRDDASGQWLENSLKFAVIQATNREPGSTAMLTKLAEAAFAETLRRYIAGLPAEEKGWLAGARDAEVGKALTVLHRRPADPWTLADLAREAGLSRTVLAQRFRHFLGESPMAYLTRWRLRLGARALAGTSESVAGIAADVGYASEAAFNRAFKREYGLPPAAYRRSHGRASAAHAPLQPGE